ncbi:WD40-repeat-containing domain protein [Dunaliella salina]|uniref:WD40-repeat-containing domain protein n=1 Tax=Dunaliella salina TaxID=3046 RepID=A0ABQ7G9R0_DUNSA|nr:WD40-repeat-containing domain protein [Dunaliella salina]|eukprot:KAF5831344.1 WD40-repeat-containing domain protein [Dunaliella salina]
MGPGRKERKVSVVLRRSDGPEHCSGIESLALTPDGSTLYTASRDSCIRKWDAASGQSKHPVCKGSLEGHTDWVNDVALLEDRVLSCSNDRTVRVWHGESGRLLSTLGHHSDYVTSIAVGHGNQLAASGGLRGELFLIDVGASACLQLRPPKPTLPPTPIPQPLPASNSTYAPGSVSVAGPQTEEAPLVHQPSHKASIYAVALNPAGSVVACGSSDHMIRLWDTRSCEKIGKLRGHTENVRSLLLHLDGSILLSGAADGTIKLWDLCMQRCVQTYNVHTDSVWALQASTDWSMVYSGGRDKCVYRTHLGTRTAELLALEEQPVRKMALDEHSHTLWVASASSSVNQWPLPTKPPVPTPNSTTKVFPANRRRVSAAHGTPGQRNCPSQDSSQGRGTAAVSEPCCTTPGLPPICDFKVLNDRRHILTKTADGVVALWDLLTGGPVQHFGKVNLEAQEKALYEPRAVPAWFSCDIRLGQLTITLEPPGCFSAEEYAQSLGHTGVPDDQKLNLGKLVLDGVFAKWRWSIQNGGATDAIVSRDGNLLPVRANGGGLGIQGAGSNMDAVYYPEMYPRFWQGVQPAVMSLTTEGQPWRILMRDFNASIPEPDFIPAWVGDVVLRNANVAPKEKAAFILVPLEGSQLPILTQSRLNAPRILQVHKVADYCSTKLKDQGYNVSGGAPGPCSIRQERCTRA